jgi:hypothetical protein
MFAKTLRSEVVMLAHGSAGHPLSPILPFSVAAPAFLLQNLPCTLSVHGSQCGYSYHCLQG